MLEKVKQFFRRRSAKTEPSVDILPRNRFADLDFERVLKSGACRLVNEEGRYAEDLGYTQKRWEKTFYFHPWILSFEENPPNLRYVADYVNDEFTVYFAKKHGRWQVYWDADCQKVIEES